MKSEQEFPSELIARVVGTLEGGRGVRRRLPAGGLIHIDRPQPFLCVYRQPAGDADTGTARLISTQASFIIAPAAAGQDDDLRQLIEALCQVLAGKFGKILLLEIWAGDNASEEQAGQAAIALPHFRVLASSRGTPSETLEELERALISAKWLDHGAPAITVDYPRRRGPPGLPSLLPAAAARRIGCVHMGLEIAPVYRDPTDGTVRPQVLHRYRRALGQALKRVFFVFSHHEAQFRPAHYHELGRRAMTKAVFESDRRLAAIGDAFDMLLHVTPVNSVAAWHAFRKDRHRQTPEFHYRPLAVDPAELKRELYRIPLEAIEDPALHHLFFTKRDELDRQLTLLGDRGTDRFMHGSQQIFGRPDDDLLQTARGLLSGLPAHAHDDKVSDFIDAGQFAARAECELAYYRRRDPGLRAGVEVRNDVPGVMVSKDRLLIGSEVHMPKARVDATLHHEIGTHILTHHNGLAQPFQQLHTGMAGYEELQEGIAVLSEYLVGGLSRPRLRTIAGRVIAVDCVVRGADFLETFGHLTEAFDFAQPSAFSMAMRVHRGGGFTKDVVYLRGLKRLLNHFAGGGTMAPLLVGKVGLDHLDIVDELTWRKIIGPAALQPRYLQDDAVLARLRRLGKPTAPIDLCQEQ